MIKFFRKIRRQLLSENKIRKYLLYAVGEIILVVIGILIALQINNWNTERKNEEIKKSYYVQILQDLEKDEILMNQGNVLIDSFFVRLAAYQKNFRENQLSFWDAATEIGKVFSTENAHGWNFETNTNTITTLINTGDIKLIPTEIRNKILDFKYKQSGLIDYTKSQNIIISNASMITQKLYGGSDMPTRIGNQPKIVAYFSDDKIALKSLLELEALLYEQSQLLKNGMDRNKELIQDIQALKTALHEELEK
ncbi:DUF6090 family protein [[Muricauda] lutisoli]|uniref:Uncharacterized protein n=1 Tax=[Muricauda] lutisoli TaxID=2816035 RepID=A0ABS3ETG4_9FLAO|nr:DUF6090 family protein [[Muricauda] lutisoli]MBO0329526.1 hypothetical protein [[Muricauda] lutisoli]